jgi:putative flippase GtrA
MSSAAGFTLNYIKNRSITFCQRMRRTTLCKQKLTRSRTELAASKHSPSTSLQDFHCVLSDLEGAAHYLARSWNRNSPAYLKISVWKGTQNKVPVYNSYLKYFSVCWLRNTIQGIRSVILTELLQYHWLVRIYPYPSINYAESPFPHVALWRRHMECDF